MSKRFTDTDKYKKPFFRALPGPYKLLWDYLYHDCNHAGIWQKDFQIAQIYLGADMQVNEEEALMLFNAGEQRINVLDGGTKWQIIPFVPFQYGSLNPANRVHQSILFNLSKYSIKPLIRPLERAKDKDKDKYKDKDKVKDKDKDKDKFLEIKERYPNSIGTKMARKHFERSVVCEQDWLDINKAMDNYLRCQRVKDGYIQNCATWFNNWRDWIVPTEQMISNGKEPKIRYNSLGLPIKILAEG